VHPSIGPGAIAAAVVAPVAAVVGAAASIVMPAFEPWNDSAMVPPEALGMRMVARVAWPVVVTTLGVVPALAPPLAPSIVMVVAAAAYWLSRRGPATT
jgi:hypothetical protein